MKMQQQVAQREIIPGDVCSTPIDAWEIPKERLIKAG
jgi:hypothetical protein